MRDLSPIRADVGAGYIALASEDGETFRLAITDELLDLLTAPPSEDAENSVGFSLNDDSVAGFTPSLQTRRNTGDESDIIDVEEVPEDSDTDIEGEAEQTVETDEPESEAAAEAEADPTEPEPERERAPSRPIRRLFTAAPGPAAATAGLSDTGDSSEEAAATDAPAAPEPVTVTDAPSEPDAPAEETGPAGSPTELRRVPVAEEADSEPTPSSEPAVHAVPKAKYVLPPREIQDRIRGGATVEELVEETGMQYKRVEVFAHPVLADRARVAEQAKSSFPQRSDGPTTLTLWEILATAFAARDLELYDTEWDARRDPTGQWIVSVSWDEDGHPLVAEWSFHQDTPTKSSTVARNSIAGELMDPGPRTALPQRGLTAVSSDSTIPLPTVKAYEEPEDLEDYEEDQIEGVAFDPDSEGERPRKKTVMPSWEDVLLGVRVRPNDRK